MPVWRPPSAKLRPSWRRLSDFNRSLFLNPATFWQLQTYDDEPIILDDWQIALVTNDARLIALEKAPQIGFSWAMALWALWECLFYQDALAGFVSVNLSEAQEKILVARKAYEQLPEQIQAQVPLLKANESELWFGEEARPSRLVSLPASSGMRGRKMTKVVLDEVDFYRDGGADSFRVMMGRIARGGQAVMGSTCLPGEVPVFTDRGPVPIAEVRAGDRVWSLDRSGKTYRQARVFRAEATGVRPVYRIDTVPRSLRATGDHRVLARRRSPEAGRARWTTDWCDVADLRTGDYLIGLNGLPDGDRCVAPNGRVLTEGFMAFAGLLLGDGTVGVKAVSVARHAEAPYARAYQAMAEQEFDARSRGAYGDRAPIRWRSYERAMTFSSAAAARELREIGFAGTAGTKRIPEWVFGLRPDLALALLRGLLDSDGAVDPRGWIVYSSVSQALLEGIRHLCMSLGIPAGRVNLNRRAGVGEVLGRVGDHRALYQLWLCSAEANRRIGSHHPVKAGRLADGRSKAGTAWTDGFRHAGPQRVRPRDGFALPAALLKVRAIVPDGIEEVFDLGVEGTHSFVADGVIVHNCFGVDTTLDQVCSRGRSHLEGSSEATKQATKFSIGCIPWWAAENEDARSMAAIAASELTPDQFAEEYECERGSAGDSYPVDLIRSATHSEDEWVITADGWIRDPGDLTGTSSAIPESTRLVVGYDVGQSRNPSVASLFALSGAQWQQRAIYAPADDRGRVLSLPAQGRLLEELLSHYPTMTLVIDAQGIGAGTSEALEETFPGRVLAMRASGVHSSQRRRAVRALSTDRYAMAVELKSALESGALALVGDREQTKQLQRTRLLPGHRVDQPGSRRRSHYDRFWALAYGWWGIHSGAVRRSVYGERGLLVVGSNRAGPAVGELRRTSSMAKQLGFVAGLVRRFLNGQPIPWETLTDEEIADVDRVLVARLRRAAQAEDAVELAAIASERRRGAAVTRERAEVEEAVRGRA